METFEKGTNEAFALLVNSPYWWSKTGLPTAQRRQALYMLNSGQGISQERKEKLLREAGFIVKQETLWNLPGTKPDKKVKK